MQASGEEGQVHPGMYRPNPEAMLQAAEAGAAYEDPDAPYRPPKRLAASMEEDPDKATKYDKQKRATHDRARKSLRSAMVQDLAREIHDMPEEVRLLPIRLQCTRKALAGIISFVHDA